MSKADSGNVASRLMAMLDLTRLEDDPDDSAVRALCLRALHAPIRPAAVCVYRRFLPAAIETLGSTSGIALATVANFPDGRTDAGEAASECSKALELGADEVDVVFPWRALLAGDSAAGATLLAACRKACGSAPLKVILESGMLDDPEAIRKASRISIDAGADFLKTSTGKVAVNATLDAAEVMLQAIASTERPVGLKISGGVRTLADATPYLELAERRLGPDAITPARFRIGASSLLDDLLHHMADR